MTLLVRNKLLLGLCATCVWGCRCENEARPAIFQNAAQSAGEADKDTASKKPEYRHEHFASPSAALRAVLSRTRPRIVGFGELHQREGTTDTLSAIWRFSESLLPEVAPRASDLVVETWISSGRCGAKEQQVTKDVDKTTQRPAETENETVSLRRRAKAQGVQPHILEIQCDDYNRVLDADGGVDYLALLELVGARLGAKAEAVLAARNAEEQKKRARASDGNLQAVPEKMVLIYCGAIHNDANPQGELGRAAFGPSLARLVGGRYAEIDLIVPEFLDASEVLREEPWYELAQKLGAADTTALIELAPDSYIIVLPRGVKNQKTGKRTGAENPKGPGDAPGRAQNGNKQ